MITTDGDGGPIAIGIVGVTCVVAAVTSVAISVVSAAVIVTTTTTAITALSFSTVAFSVPFAMHLSRYGRLPSCSIGGCRCRRGYRGSGSRTSCCSSPFLLLPQRSLLPCLPQPMLLLQFQSFMHHGRHKAQRSGWRRKHVWTIS